jgi:hypothetical protein
MKIYSLRLEQPESILGHLAGDDTHASGKLKLMYAEFVSELREAISECAAERVRVEIHEFSKLEHAKRALMQAGKPYLCFDSQSSLGTPFGISRCFDMATGWRIGITSRPGFAELHDQISQYKQDHHGACGIVEDDIFTGGTLREAIELLGQAGIQVDTIVSGITTAKHVAGVPVLAAVTYEAANLFELTDPRDFVWGAHNGGVVVRCGALKARVPYDQAFADITERASIAPEKAALFTERIRAANLRLHQALGSASYQARMFYPVTVLEQAGFDPGRTLGQLLAAR